MRLPSVDMASPAGLGQDGRELYRLKADTLSWNNPTLNFKDSKLSIELENGSVESWPNVEQLVIMQNSDSLTNYIHVESWAILVDLNIFQPLLNCVPQALCPNED